MDDEKTLRMAADLDAANPAMTPIPLPEGYRAVYLYRQPVTGRYDALAGRGEKYTDYGGWGQIDLELDHCIGFMREVRQNQEYWKTHGLNPVGPLRLVKQTFYRKRAGQDL